MKNCDREERAKETIATIAAKIDPTVLKSQFDDPILRVASEFSCDAKIPVTHRTLNRIVTNFVQQVYERALKASWVLTDPLNEAVFLLERHYHSPVYGPGYAGALMHANDEAQGGIQAVVTGLAESIKNIERQKYVEGVFIWHLHGCSWELLCEITRRLLEECQPFIPPQMRRCDPAQLVDEIQSVIHMCVHSEFMLQQISLCGERPLRAETLLSREMPQLPNQLAVHWFDNH